MWFGLSVKCLVIRSPPDASTRRSQLRHTKVNLGEDNEILHHAKFQTEKTVFNVQKILIITFTYFNEDGVLLWSIFCNTFLVLWNLRKTKEIWRICHRITTLGQQWSAVIIKIKILLTLSYDSQWKFCNLFDTCMHHKPKPLGNGKRSGQLLSSTRYMCIVLHQHWKLKERAKSSIKPLRDL